MKLFHLQKAPLSIYSLGGMIWKGEVGAQRLTMEKMDPNTAQLIQKIKRLLDPNGIMNPGNWEIDTGGR